MKATLRLAAVAAAFFLSLPSALAQQWQKIDGGAKDVGVGKNGTAWVIGTSGVAGGYEIYRRDGSAWTRIPGGAVRIAVDPAGNAWVVNSSNSIFKYTGSQWVTVAGEANDVGIGANGQVWVIGKYPETGGFGIYRSTDGNGGWTKIAGAAVRISVDPSGNAWVVNNANNIYRFNGSSWVQVTGAAVDIGVGADGQVWVIHPSGAIYRYTGSGWEQKAGAASQIAAGSNGVVWVVNSGGEMFTASMPVAASTSPQVAAAAPVVTEVGLTNVSGAAPDTTTATAGPEIVVSSGPADPYAQSSSGPECGGMVNGVAQSKCTPKSATKVGDSLKTCPTGTFLDITTSACWSCPTGYVRSAAPVISEQACSQDVPTVRQSEWGGSSQAPTREPAKFIGPRCPTGSFFDPIRGGECWSCPSGTNRSAAHIEADNACYVAAGERFSVATKVKSTPWPHECSGSFWDGYGPGCYTCPAGYARTGYHIADSKACSQAVAEQQYKATLVAKGQCEADTIFDPRNGGECWKCSTGFLRTVYPINENQACEMPSGVNYRPATKAASFTCNPGEHFDPIDGGTCWKCPAGYDRTASPVTATDACKTDTMIWKTATYKEPGLFGFAGAEEVLNEIVRTNPALVKQVLTTVSNKVAQQYSIPVEQARSDQLTKFLNTPYDSLVAQGLVLTRLVAAATDPTKASAGEKKLLGSFGEYLKKKRTYIAQDRLNAYDNWSASNDYWRGVYHLNQGLAGTVSYGTVPPSFDKLGMATTLGVGVTSTATSMAIDATTETLKFAKAAQKLSIFGDVLGVALSAAGAGWRSSTSPELIALSATRSAAEIAAGQAIGLLLSSMAQVPAASIVSVTGVASAAGMPAATLSIAGPQIIVAAGMMVISIAVDQFVQIQEARPKLVSALTFAQTPPDLARMMKTKEGMAETETFWAQAVGASQQPSSGFMAAYKPLAQVASQ